MIIFSLRASAGPQASPPPEEIVRPRLGAYRRRTIGLLHRYFRMAMETGRLPSVLGGNIFRARFTSYRLMSFEDAVIFVHDVESCLQALDPFSREVIGVIVLQGYKEEEAARVMHCPLRTIERWFPRALDELTELFLARDLLTKFVVKPPEAAKNPQVNESKAKINSGKVAG